MSTLHDSLHRAGLRVKRVQKLASERDPIKRADFVRRIGEYPPQCLVFLDEVSKDNRTYARLWGRAAAGVRVEKHNPFVRKRRLSMLAALAFDKGIIASRVVEGSFTHGTFMEYLRDDLVSHPPYRHASGLNQNDQHGFSYPSRILIPVPKVF